MKISKDKYLYREEDKDERSIKNKSYNNIMFNISNRNSNTNRYKYKKRGKSSK